MRGGKEGGRRGRGGHALVSVVGEDGEREGVEEGREGGGEEGWIGGSDSVKD